MRAVGAPPHVTRCTARRDINIRVLWSFSPASTLAEHRTVHVYAYTPVHEYVSIVNPILLDLFSPPSSFTASKMLRPRRVIDGTDGRGRRRRRREKNFSPGSSRLQHGRGLYEDCSAAWSERPVRGKGELRRGLVMVSPAR